MTKTRRIPHVLPEHLAALVECFLREMEDDDYPYSATRLGREARNDPNLVFQLRSGREFRRATVTGVVMTIERHRPGFTTQFLNSVDKAKRHGK